MLASELLKKLQEIVSTKGDYEIRMNIGYFGGDYGSYNASMTAPVEEVYPRLKASRPINHRGKVISGKEVVEFIEMYGWEKYN